MNRGYIKFWRKVEDSGLLRDGPLLQVFTYILVKATHRDIKTIAGTTPISLKRGQLITGRKRLSCELNLSERQVRTALKTLGKMEIIDQQTTNKFTIVSIINYDTYQSERPAGDQQSDQQTTSKRPASDQETTTKQEHKNIRIKNKTKRAILACSTDGNEKFGYDEMVNAYTTDQDLRLALREFIVMRKAAKKPFTSAALKHTFSDLDKLAGADNAAKIASLNQSVQRGWLGVFALKEDQNGRITPSRNGNVYADGRERDYGQSDFGALGGNT